MTGRSRLQTPPHGWLAAVAVAVGLHVLFLLGLGYHWGQRTPKKPAKARPVAARPMPFMSDAEAKKLMARVSKAPVPVTVAPEKKKEEPKPALKANRQIVEIPPPKNQEIPDSARFASSYNSKVEREQVSSNVASPTPKMRKSDRRLISKGNDMDGTTRANPKPKPTKKTQKRSKVALDGDAKRKGAKRSADARRRAKALKVERRKSAKLTTGDGLFKPKTETAAPQESSAPLAGGKLGGTTAPSDYRALLPTLGAADMEAKDGSIDHIEDVDRGDRTMLNSREFKYAWFFNRVKRSVQKRWHAVDAHRRYDPYNRIYGVRDRHSVVQVTLNADGSLDDIHLSKDSGVAFLDEAALNAFHLAQPFPNPPQGLRDPDGRIRFQFGFYLDMSGRPGMFRR